MSTKNRFHCCTPRSRSAAVRGVLCLLALFALPCTVRSQLYGQSHYERDVVPVLEKHCAECHSAEHPNGGIDFSTPASLFREADSGATPVVPGDVEASELLSRVTSRDEDLRMPPEGDMLGNEAVARLRSWIASGAEVPKHLREKKSLVESAHWAFQPLRAPELPDVADVDWCWTPIDFFVAAKREEQGIETARDANLATLVRRSYYGLTGLPPRMEDVARIEGFVEESGNRQAAVADLVDSLLMDSAYGEKWGRHWMDWVRYADTAGCNSDFPIPQAYLYRNYIIQSLNDDLPYDQFLTEQLAGDLLPAANQEEKNRLVIATGYLAMARRFGSLVETYPWHLTIEDTIDNLGRTMLGLTIACARCHDHKFDPISTRDYYGLYGIFESTNYPFPGIELFQVQHDMVPLLPEAEVAKILGEHAETTAQLVAKLDAELAKCRKQELANAEREASLTLAEQRKQYNALQGMLGKARKMGSALADHLKQLPDVPVAYGVQEGTSASTRIQIKGDATRLGAEVPRKFPDVLGGYEVQDQAVSGRLELAKWIVDSNNPLTARVIVNRVWAKHFGQGLVASTSDFGTRGEMPSHPELLYWLAVDFMSHGWSLKHLHRRIMNSHTYSLASEFDHDRLAASQTKDPTNRYLWRFNRFRLDAEAIRDSLLFLSGELDRTPQMEPYAIPPQKDWKYTQHHPFNADYPSRKRSVYQMTKRLTVGPYMQTFDGPDPNVCTSKRDQSVTSLQALYFVNDAFLHEQAEQIARRIVSEHKQPADRAKAAVESVLSRAATPAETELIRGHVQSVATRSKTQGESRDLGAWSSAIRALLRLNEFVYVD